MPFLFLVCFASFGAVTGLGRVAGGVGMGSRVRVLRHFGCRQILMSTEGQGCGHAKSTALKASSTDPPYKEAYGYARDTENRLANQLATGLADVKAAVKETNDLLEKNAKESKELVQKTAKESKELVEKTAKESRELVEKNAKESRELVQKTAKESKELVEKNAKESRELVQKTAKESKELVEKNAKESRELVEKTVERTNLISFLGFASLAVLVSMQPELRVFFSLFLSKIK
jgi:uncharacterized membrane-anchored protein YhcB (DUF1043 family)